MVLDSIVVGHGPAGITAGIYLKRANKNVLVIGKDFGVLDSSNSLIENYYGIPSIKGVDLARSAIMQAKSLGCEILTDEIITIEYGDILKVYTETNCYETKTVLLATGQKRETPNIKGLKKYIGRGVSYCVTCDGYFFKNKTVALIGSSTYMLHELKELENLTKNIIIFTNGEKLLTEVPFKIVSEKISSITGDEYSVHEISTLNQTFKIDGVFIALGSSGGLDIARKLGILFDNNEIIVDSSNETNLKGIFAAGDIIAGKKQVIKACYDGMKAASGIIEYLRTKR